MTRTLLVTLACSALACFALACGKEKPTTTVPFDDGASDTGDEPFVADVPQEPDPPELLDGRKQYLLGQYEQAIGTLTPLYDDLKARSQYRASALAAGWLALAHAQSVYENADAPSQHAMAMADKTRDPEVVAVAKLARGAFLMGEEDFAAAQQSFVAAAAADPKGTAGAMAEVLRGEALIGSAFGGGDSTTLQRPGDLDEAKKAYAAAESAAKGTPDAEILLGRVQEGLAAIAKYKHDKKAICQHAFAAIDHYKAAGAAERLLEGPNGLANDEKCEG